MVYAPAAATEKFTLSPMQIVSSAGCVPITGAVCIVSVTAFDVADILQVLVTTQRYMYPSIVTVGLINCSVFVVAPVYTPPLVTSFQLAPISVLTSH